MGCLFGVVRWFRELGLGACAPLMVGGLCGGARGASDRRTSGIELEDETIELRSASRIRDMLGSRVHINITSYNRQVLLTGEVPAQKDKDYANQLVSQVDNVRSVVNELVIAPTSSIADRSMDTLISGKVKACLLTLPYAAETLKGLCLVCVRLCTKQNIKH